MKKQKKSVSPELTGTTQPSKLRYCVGIDCGSNELVCALLTMDSCQQVQTIAKKAFANSSAGFKALHLWASQKAKKQSVLYVVEATGVYHEQVAVFLYDKSEKIAVIQPNRSFNHTKTLQMKTVTDLTSSVVIADYGLRHSPTLWTKPKAVYLELRNLSRERAQLIEDKVSIMNQLHAIEHSAETNAKSIKRKQALVKFLLAQIKEIEKELERVPEKDAELKAGVSYITSIPGIGELSAFVIIGETLGFNGFTSSKQVVSYAGLDVIKKESGTSVRGKSRISKRGNKNLRTALYFPAMSAIKCNDHHKNQLLRITEKTGIKMKGYVAIQRKLLILAFELWKKQEIFDPNYVHHTKKKSERSLLTAPTVLMSSATESIAV